MMAFIDNDLAVFGDTVINRPTVHQTLNKGNIDCTAGFTLSSAYSPNLQMLRIQECVELSQPLVKEVLSVH